MFTIYKALQTSTSTCKRKKDFYKCLCFLHIWPNWLFFFCCHNKILITKPKFKPYSIHHSVFLNFSITKLFKGMEKWTEVISLYWNPISLLKQKMYLKISREMWEMRNYKHFSCIQNSLSFKLLKLLFFDCIVHSFKYYSVTMKYSFK